MTTADQPIRLLCDGTLGALSRWLRCAGVDTGFQPPLPRSHRDSTTMLDTLRTVSREEQRTVLTRSRRVQEALGPPALLIHDDVVFHQVLEVARALGVSLTKDALTRCREDNGVLRNVGPKDVQGRVPAYVAATQSLFVECPVCQRVYWGASHRDSMVERLEELERLRLGGQNPPGSWVEG